MSELANSWERRSLYPCDKAERMIRPWQALSVNLNLAFGPAASIDGIDEVHQEQDFSRLLLLRLKEFLFPWSLNLIERKRFELSRVSPRNLRGGETIEDSMDPLLMPLVRAVNNKPFMWSEKDSCSGHLQINPNNLNQSFYLDSGLLALKLSSLFSVSLRDAAKVWSDKEGALFVRGMRLIGAPGVSCSLADFTWRLSGERGKRSRQLYARIASPGEPDRDDIEALYALTLELRDEGLEEEQKKIIQDLTQVIQDLN